MIVTVRIKEEVRDVRKTSSNAPAKTIQSKALSFLVEQAIMQRHSDPG